MTKMLHQDATRNGTERTAAPIKERTRKGYLVSVRAAINHSTAKRTTDWEEPAIVTLTQVVEDMISREDLERSTKLTTRAALLWYMKSGEAQPGEDSIRARAILEKIVVPRGPKTKITRPKTIREEDLAKILDDIYRRADRSSWAMRCAVWIHAGLATGVRPIEWLDAEWADPEQTTLRVKTAKVKLLAPAFLRQQTDEDHEVDHLDYWEADNENPYREIPLSKESEQSMVDTQLQYIADAIPRDMSEAKRREEFVKYFNACRKVLYRACRQIWGGKRMYSLYTLRSQFAANMQASRGADATAVLMGHSSADSPSAAYYGKWNQAHGRFKSSKFPHRENLMQSAFMKDVSTPAAGPVE